MFTSTNDKILKVLIANQNADYPSMLGAVRSAFPRLSEGYILSAFSALARQDFVSLLRADDVILDLNVNHDAEARLKEKHETSANARLWDALKILFGFILGYLSKAFIFP